MGSNPDQDSSFLWLLWVIKVYCIAFPIPVSFFVLSCVLLCYVVLPFISLCVRLVMICVDLMLPGVVGKERGGETVQGLEKGQTCAVTLVGSRYKYIQ